MSSEELEKLAAEARTEKVLADALEQAKKLEEARELRQEYESVLWSSVSAIARWGWKVAAFLVGIAVSVITANLLPASAFPKEGGWGPPLSITTFFLGFAITWPLRRVFGRRAVVDEEQWVASLPFKLDNYMRTLKGPASFGVLTLALNYEDSVPKLELVSDAFRASGATVTQHDRQHQASVSWEWEDSGSNNYHVVEWVRRVAPTLIALHAKWRLKSVTVKASWS